MISKILHINVIMSYYKWRNKILAQDILVRITQLLVDMLQVLKGR